MLSTTAEDTEEHIETDQKNFSMAQLKALGPLASGAAVRHVAKAIAVVREV